jgi:RNA polymerase sigma factor (sigma-70 family)
MATGQTSKVIGHLRRAVLLQEGAGLTDGQLLGCLIERRDEAAFAALVKRHGAMVWGVCRRLLTHHDAEDAFQATFLVLFRKAASIRPREMVANWLYGVARQTALQARRTAARRRARERQVVEMPETAVEEPDRWHDLQPLLDEELSRLPDRYRGLIVLCDLEGKTRKEVARQLGCPEGTVAGRLARARALLAKRLARHGLVVSGGVLTAVLSQNVASAGVPTSVVSSTIKAASLFAGGNVATGAISAKVAALTERVLKAMMMTKLKAAFVLMFVISILGWGGGLVVWQTQAQAHQKVRLGELADEQPIPDLSGSWQGDGWGTVVLRPGKKGAFEGDYTDTFGKDVGRIAVQWSAASRRYEGTWSEGKFRFGRIALEAAKNGEEISGAWTTDRNCEHQPGVPSLASLRWSRRPPAAEGREKLPQKREQKGFTSWGKEINGLQAGLGLRSGEKRSYHHGEAVTLIVRIRNVGKEAVKFSYLQPFIAHSPTVTESDGKPVSQPEVLPDVGEHIPAEVELAPGKEIELDELKRLLRPASESGSKEFMQPLALYGTGKVAVQYDQVLGPTEAAERNRALDPALSKLVTGKLELEVKDAEKLPEKKEKEGFTAWGKEVGGLQAGLGYHPGEKRTYYHGEKVKLVVRVRNVGKETVKFEYLKQFFMEMPPTVTDTEGKSVLQLRYEVSGEIHLPVEVSLPPGKETELYELKLELKAGNKVVPDTLWASGKVSLQYERLFGNTGAGQIKLDPTLSKLATGKLELEVKAEPPW